MKVHIPKNLKDVEPQIKAFFDAMIFKLSKNAHKGPWPTRTLDDTVKLLLGEVEELKEAIVIGNTVETILEAADIANFALIAASVAIRDAGKHEPETPLKAKKAVRNSKVGNRAHHSAAKRRRA